MREISKFWCSHQQMRAIFAFLVFSAQVVAGPGFAQQAHSEFGEVKGTDQAYKLLVALAKNAVSDDSNLGRNRVSISDRTLMYDFQPVGEDSLTAHPGRLTSCLEILIRVEALRRDFQRYLPNEQFWGPPLKRIQNLTSRMLQAAYNSTSEDEWRKSNQGYEDQVAGEFAALEGELVAYARTAGLDMKSTRGAQQGYKVEIRIEPAKARLKFMPFLDYRRCIAFKLNLKDYWVVLSPGTHTLIGKYRYLAEWPPSLSGPEEDNFEIAEEGMKLTFQPKGN